VPYRTIYRWPLASFIIVTCNIITGLFFMFGPGNTKPTTSFAFVRYIAIPVWLLGLALVVFSVLSLVKQTRIVGLMSLGVYWTYLDILILPALVSSLIHAQPAGMFLISLLAYATIGSWAAAKLAIEGQELSKIDLDEIYATAHGTNGAGNS
jgi:hypothetical protein